MHVRCVLTFCSLMVRPGTISDAEKTTPHLTAAMDMMERMDMMDMMEYRQRKQRTNTDTPKLQVGNAEMILSAIG